MCRPCCPGIIRRSRDSVEPPIACRKVVSSRPPLFISSPCARAKAEVPVFKYVVIDCEARAVSQCEGAGNLLKQLGYGRVALLEPRH